MSSRACLSRIRRRTLEPLLAAASVVLLGACGSTSITSTGPSPIKCLVTLTGPVSSLGPSASVGAVTVSTAPECAWTATADANWVVRLDPASGQGSGTVHVSVGANPSTVARETDVVVNGARARIQQEPALCVYVLSESSATVDASGRGYQVSVSTSAGCAWTASSATPWISITAGSSGTGSGSVELAVEANDGSARTGDVTIAGQSFTFVQGATGASGVGGATPGCTYVLSSRTQSVPAGGGGGSLSLTTSCAWSATPSATWITIQSPASGNGNAALVFSVAPNSGSARHGTITVGTAIVSIDQAAATKCAFIVNPLTVPVASTATTGLPLSITTTSGCTWTAASNATWITVTAGASGSASGTVEFQVEVNTGAARDGTLAVAGQTVTVSQASGCSYAVNSATVSIGAAGGVGPAVAVSSASGCAWTAASGTSWLTITSGATGSGDGTVRFSASQNTGEARSGSLSIAGQIVTVNQASGCAYTVAVSPTSFKNKGGTAVGTVTTVPGCTWTTSSDSSWIVVESGATGSGSGMVTLQIQENFGGSRTGTVTIAGHSFAIKQSK